MRVRVWNLPAAPAELPGASSTQQWLGVVLVHRGSSAAI